MIDGLEIVDVEPQPSEGIATRRLSDGRWLIVRGRRVEIPLGNGEVKIAYSYPMGDIYPGGRTVLRQYKVPDPST
jgi:hypothetical protein